MESRNAALDSAMASTSAHPESRGEVLDFCIGRSRRGWQHPLHGRISVNGHIGFALR